MSGSSILRRCCRLYAREASMLSLAAIFAAASISGAAAAADHPVEDGRMPEVTVIESSESGVGLSFEMPELVLETVDADGRRFTLATIPGGSLAGEVGQPALPAFSRLVAIPNRSGVRITVTPEEEEILTGHQILPMQPDEEDAPFALDQTAYSRQGYGDRPLARHGDPAILRDLRVVPLTFSPVQFDPAEGTVRVVRRMRVEVEFAGVDLRNARQDNDRPMTPSFYNLYRRTVANFPEMEQSELVPGSYLIICPNNSSVVDLLQPLVEWRERKGNPVILATTAETGTSASSIKSYIQNVYDSADPPLEFVCLAGDATTPYQIRTWFESLSGYGGEGDHPYTQLEGSDVLADVHIGRLSYGDLTKLEVIVGKTVGYESTPYMDETGWYTRGCLCGDWDTQTGWSAVYVNQWVKTALQNHGYTEVDTIWYEPYVTNMISKLNRGDTVFSYRGWWGMSGWSNSYAYSLDNGWKMPFCVNITCDTGTFSEGTAFSEGFLLAGSMDGDVVEPAGGIGSIGTATIGTHTRYNNCMHYGIFQGLLYEDQFHQGAALTRGKMEMYLNYQADEPNIVTIWSYWNNLMGDPAVEIWTAVPREMTVDHPASIYRGSNSFTINVNQGPLPVPNARVCLKKENETYIVGYTDANGEAELPITTETTGDLLVTVTKHNFQPHLATVAVNDAALFLGYLDSAVDDDTSGESNGNGDGLVNPGEAIELPVQLKNFGTINGNDVQAHLTSGDPYVTITDADEMYGDMPGGTTAWSAEDYDFTVGPGAPHGHALRFGLDASSGANEYHSLIEVDVVSAQLDAENAKLYNVGGNGILDPGESGELSVLLRNNGGAEATGVTATLESLSSLVAVTDSEGSYDDIGVGNSAENEVDRFGISADAGAYPGYLANLMVITQFSGGAIDTAYAGIVIGERDSSDPIGPDGYGYWAFDDTDTSYPEAPVYEWIEIDPNYGGDGTLVNLSDYGEYEDDTQTVDLPFEFQYYGETYTRASICSNGWLSMGSTYLVQYRNWTIPGAGGPDALIAPFWDNLYRSGDAAVYQKYDAANHRWIVEWSRMRNFYNSAIETFQAILYDPAYYTTGTGDGIIVFQYNQIANVDSGNNYCTVGIENADHTDGLLYTYYNHYPDGAPSLTSGRAIKFMPVVQGPTGTLAGTVRNDYNNNPIMGATVTLVEDGRFWTTGSDGGYGGLSPVGTYTVAVEHAAFAPDSAFDVEIVEGEEVQVDFHLTDIAGPLLTTTPFPETTDDTEGPYPIPVTVEEYSGLDEATLYYRTNGGSFTALPLVHQEGQEYLAEIPGQPYVTVVEYYVYARDGLSYESYDPEEAPDELYSFTVIPTLQIFWDDMEASGGWTVGAPGDDADTGIWERVDPNATYEGGEMVQPEDDHTPDPGTMCFITGQSAPGAGQGDNDVDGGTTTLISPTLDLSGMSGQATLSYYRWYTNDTGFSTNDSWVVQITDDGSTWVELENTTASDRSWRLMEFNLADYVAFTDQIQIRFIASDLGEGGIVEAGVDDVELLFTGTSGAPEIEGGPTVFSLLPNRPNPASGGTTIRFSLAQDGPARVLIYDVQGRLLRRLVDGRQSAGLHAV
ncbi:MAG: hypothetical protein GF355_00935, partial [Candidatus Eisenbacteria bacterium]|nr:hypothetical protein [Candidatus Eisenbacteria bacterium]